MNGVSCIVAAYNSSRFLSQAVESILTQTCPPLEIIIVDDGSTDATPDIAGGFGPPVRLVRQATAGPPATRNTGLRQARGEFIALLDADDCWHPEKLERQLERMESKPDLDVCVGMVQNEWEPEQNEEYLRLRNHARARPVPGYVSGAMLARWQVFRKVGFFDEALWFADGAQWFMRAQALGVNIELMPEVLLFHRMHDENISRRRSNDSKKEFLALARQRLRQVARPESTTAGK